MKHLLSILLLLSFSPVLTTTKTKSAQPKKKITVAKVKQDKTNLNKVSTQSKKKITEKTEDVTVITVDNSNFEKLVLNAKTPILLDVYADWCGPCRRMAPIFEEVSKQYFKGKKITFAKIKMDGFEKSDKHVKLLKEKLGVDITMIPTFLYVEKGKVVEQIVGSQNAANLNTKIASLINKPIKSERNLA